MGLATLPCLVADSLDLGVAWTIADRLTEDATGGEKERHIRPHSRLGIHIRRFDGGRCLFLALGSLVPGTQGESEDDAETDENEKSHGVPL